MVAPTEKFDSKFDFLILVAPNKLHRQKEDVKGVVY
jgi:hypothetical protein